MSTSPLEIFAESQDRLRTLNIYITVNPELDQITVIKNSENVIKLQFGHNTFDCRFEGLKLVEDTAMIKDITKTSLYFQCFTKPESSHVGSYGMEFLSLKDDEHQPPLLPPLKAGISYTFRCKSCTSDVSDCLNFKRVLPLPSTNWELSTTEWFCHNHGECTTKKAKLSINANHLDCLYGVCFYVIHPNALKLKEVDKSLLCSNCGFNLGSRSEIGCVLWNHALLFNNSMPTSEYSDSLKLIENIIGDLPPLAKIGMTATDASGDKICLVLWIVERNARVFIQNSDQIFCQKSAFKILYDCELNGSDLVRKMKRDFSSKFIAVTFGMVKCLIEKLSLYPYKCSSHLYKCGNYSVGFLMKE
ncbi:uncharacterized protein LOC136026690 isoform X1 [Artemia franciscana]|uniref:uncharacterized protein LOC136026690 isoform X1 n=1 Tax=Artemia franciscana TaxID=6661 RepID=UPI0032DB949C